MDPFCKAYVQGDWVASEQCVTTGEGFNTGIGQSYQSFLDQLAEGGIENVATWHIKAQGAISPPNKVRSTDSFRNCREVDQADCVISLLQRKDPPRKHWGSLSMMAYAIGKGKPCYVVADDDCVIWTSHFMHHPLIIRCQTVEDIVQKLSG